MGTGHPWPVLSAERGEHDLVTGQATSAGQLLAAMGAMSSGVGLVPEQVWDAPNVAASPFGTDPTIASIGFVNGKPDGSAAPLTWGAGSQVRLTADLTAGRLLEQPAQTVDRYVTHTQLATTLTVTSPPDQTAATNPIHVAGTAVPGATVDVADVGTGTTTHASGTAAADGSFSFNIAPLIGNNVLVVTSTAPNGGTAQAVRTVVNDVVHGTLLFDVTDPTGDDNGPGNYAYPTALGLPRRRVRPDRLPGLRHRHHGHLPRADPRPDADVRQPARRATGRRLRARAGCVADVDSGVLPATQLRDRAGERVEPAARSAGLRPAVHRFTRTNTVGTITISANAISRYITFSVDKAALGGTPASGWIFTVVLTGQDGFSPDQARGFQPTPQHFQFGVCATASTDPHCTVDPATVPKAWTY